LPSNVRPIKRVWRWASSLLQAHGFPSPVAKKLTQFG